MFARDASGNLSQHPATFLRGSETTLTTTTNPPSARPNRIVYGPPVSVYHEMEVMDLGSLTRPHAPLTLQVRFSRTDGTWTAWANLVTQIGKGFFGHTPVQNAQYRSVHVGGGARTASVSPVRSVEVAPAVSIRATAVSVPRSMTTSLSGTVGPAHPGRVVQLQARTGSTWSPVTEQKLSPTSTYRFDVRQSTRATVTYRVAFRADGDHVTGSSPWQAVSWR